MKISVICNDRFPSKIAHGVYLARTCDALSGEGVDVELIVPKRFGEVKCDPFSYYDIKNKFKITKIRSFDFIIFSKYLKNFAFLLQYFNFYFFLFFYFLFRSRKRVIYTMDYLGCLLSFLGFKVIFESHDWIGRHKRLVLFLMKRADLIVVTNNIIKEKFLQNGFLEGKMLVAPNGVDIDKFNINVSKQEARKKLNFPEDKTIILYSGNVYKRKGVGTLIDSLGFLPENYLLVVVGGLEKEANKRDNAESEDDNRLRMVGFKMPSEIPLYLKMADILVLPNSAKYATSSEYTSPMKLFEYLASQRPIVASDVLAVREILGQNTAVLVTPDDPKELALVIESVSRDLEKQKRIVANSWELVQNFTWKKRAQKIINFVGNN